MTAYNREKYIAEAIESVLAQTFKDFELIIVDDGSEDRTVEIARRHSGDPRVRLHLNEKNLGDYPNRNRAAALAAGSYLKYVDSDDLIYPHGLEVMVRAMEQFPDSAFGLCKPDYYINRAPYPLQLSPVESYRWHFLRTGLFGNAPASAIIRRDAFQAIGGFSGKRYVGDVELWLRLGARYPAVILPPGLTWWRSHAEQEIKYEETGGDTVNLFYSVALEALNSPVCPLSPEERAEAIRRLKRDHARHVLRLAATGQPASAWRLLKAASFSWGDLKLAFSSAEKQISS
jgi:hypothetical protein